MTIQDIKLIISYATDKTVVLPDYIKNLRVELTNVVNESKYDYPVHFGNKPTDYCMTDGYCDTRATWYYNVFDDATAQFMPDENSAVSELLGDYFMDNDLDVDADDYHYNLCCRLINIIEGGTGECDVDEMICEICSELLDASEDAYWAYWGDCEDEDEDE